MLGVKKRHLVNAEAETSNGNAATLTSANCVAGTRILNRRLWRLCRGPCGRIRFPWFLCSWRGLYRSSKTLEESVWRYHTNCRTWMSIQGFGQIKHIRLPARGRPITERRVLQFYALERKVRITKAFYTLKSLLMNIRMHVIARKIQCQFF